ncbi:hypothetical protein CH063_04193 [Colletotrichum higginsianum]|uniref:Uncharacterized protein n=1 Tax=Colletotrichum higginsianum (strain IMI 349063) TaxID=759273 RepID=H1W4X7_COLHI|nr:hypothetical protein CH063_04193 [Colletotrichum higginsianum]
MGNIKRVVAGKDMRCSCFATNLQSLETGVLGNTFLGKVELVMILGAVCWRASALLLPVGLSDADGNTRAVFWNSLCLFSYFSLFDDGLYLNISRSWEGLLHGSCISGRWEAMCGGVHLAWALFASISEELCVSGKRYETINGSGGFWDGERDTFWGCTGNAQDVKGVQGGRATQDRSCGAKPARRNAIYDMFILTSVLTLVTVGA